MIEPCRLIYPYYENPEMLKLQVQNWDRIGGELKEKVRFVIVDDHSKRHPALPIVENCKAKLDLYRFKTPGLWTMHEARNLGAFQSGKDDNWLYMSDIDLIITPEMLYSLLSRKLDPSKSYTFERVFAGNVREPKYHCNSFLVKKHVYERINGYDVDFCGLYGGGYGGDGEFLRQMQGMAPRIHLTDITLVGYERDIVKDANTTDWDREEWKKKYRAVFDKKRKTGDMRSIKPVRREWEKLK